MSDHDSIRIGIVHSLTGSLAISESPLRDAALMAIAEINAAGGVLGRLLEPIVVDGASNPQEFARQAQRLLAQEQVVALFGCWTSASRKALLPVLEAHNALLWYPVQYEGLEQSPHVFYTGACPNQQIEPALGWLFRHYGRRFYLVGSDYVFPRMVNRIVEAQLHREGGKILGEDYVPIGTSDFAAIMQQIAAVQPDVIFNTLNGDSNLSFYQAYAESGLKAKSIPVMATSIAEPELKAIAAYAEGTFASWSYFQSIDHPDNRRFVENFRARYGNDRITSASIVHAYIQVYLWKQAVEAAQSVTVDQVRQAAYGQRFQGPGGLVQIEPNQHLRQFCRIGKVLATGQFEVVYRTDVTILPKPWMGLEDTDFPNRSLVMSLLAQVSQGIQTNCELEQKSQALEQTIAQLQQKNIEQQQAESELQALFQAMTDLVIVYDRHGRYLKVVSHDPSELYDSKVNRRGKTVYEVLPPQVADDVVACIQQVLDTQATMQHEYCLTIQDQERWFSANVSPLSADTVIWVARDISERKQAEEDAKQREAALQKANAETNALFMAMDQLIFVFDREGRHLKIPAVNPRLQYEPFTDRIGKTLHEVFSQEIADQFLGYIHQALDTGETITVEYSLILDGQEIWSDASISPIDETTVLWVTRDVTDRKLADAALRYSEALNRSMLEAIPDLIARVNADGVYLHFKPFNGIESIFQDQDVVGKRMHDVMPAEIVQQRMDAIHQVLATGQVQFQEYRIVMANGAVRYQEARFSRVGDSEVLMILRDITDRKAAEEALRLAEENYRSIVENAIDGIFRTSPSGQYLQANLALARICGYDSVEAMVTNITDVQHQLYVNPRDRDRFIAEISAYDKVANFESQVFRQDGSIIWISENARAVRDAQGNLLYYEGTVTDITQRKQAEEALAKANAEILALNERLKAENLRMGAELDITRRLQQMVLPKKTELQAISNLDIAGFMEPASEIGGDYYDVLNQNGMVTFGIGDVTGHGLESGVLMLMVQTAVRTLLTSGETNPETFLRILNEIIYDNVQRMDCDRSLTLSLINYHAGTLRLSGQHEELIVIRATGDVERIDTTDLGFPIGLVPDISGFVGYTHIDLNPGDVVLLYTDGIPEAENQAGELYGIERLCQIARQHHHRSAEEIQQAIVTDVRQHIGTHRVYDDITLLVFKQK